MHEPEFSTMAQYSADPAKMFHTAVLRVGLMLLVCILAAPSALAFSDQDSKPANFNLYLQLLQKEVNSAGDLVDQKYFDFDAVLRDVGRDPNDLFEWVKSNTP